MPVPDLKAPQGRFPSEFAQTRCSPAICSFGGQMPVIFVRGLNDSPVVEPPLLVIARTGARNPRSSGSVVVSFDGPAAFH
jgi:hypothetical protein